MVSSIGVSGYGGIGRRARFRFWWETVQVQVLLPAVSKDVKKHRDSLYLLGFPVLSIFLLYILPMMQRLLQTGGMIMAKAGMRRPSPYDADNHGTENHHKMNRPENKQAQVPEIQGAAKNGNAKAGPIHAPNWARDDYKTGDHE